MANSAALFRASNLVAMDYPFAGALASALAICDEAVVIVGQSEDQTLQMVRMEAARYPGRVKVQTDTFHFDRLWQEKWWNQAAALTDADWLMYHDADEAIHPRFAAELRATMELPHVRLIRFPYVHLYGTNQWRVRPGKGFYEHNTRLGRRSAGYRMVNLRRDDNPGAAACAMLVDEGGYAQDAHHPGRAGLVTLEHMPILHYGWCRTARALAISQAKHNAWYADGAGLEDGHLPEVEPYDFRMAERMRTGFLARYNGDHPPEMAAWFGRHFYAWGALNAAENEAMRKAMAV